MKATPTMSEATGQPGCEQTGGLCLTDEDNNSLRLVVVVPWDLPGGWEQWRELFNGGPVTVSSQAGPPITYDGGSRRLREPVRRRLLDPSKRRHLLHEHPVPLHSSEKDRLARGRPAFHVLAWDVLHVETTTCTGPDTPAGAGGQGCSRTRVLVAMHTVLAEPGSKVAFEWVRNLVREKAGREELEWEVRRCLRSLSGQQDVGHGFGATQAGGVEAAAPYTVVYVPRDLVHAPPQAPPPQASVEAYSAWLWGELPRRRGKAYTDPDVQARLQPVHQLSRTWSAYAGGHGCAFCQLEHHTFRPLVHLEGRLLEAVLLVLVQHYRATSLMTRLAQLHARAPDDVDRVIELDSEAVGFVVAEQWDTMADNDRQLDGFLRYLLDTYRISEMVKEARDQAYLLRENVLMRLGREEQKMAERKARSSRVIEVALAFMSFVGLPLSIFMEVWVNWSPAPGLAGRRAVLLGASFPWWATLGLGVMGSLGVGGLFWFAAFRYGRRRGRR